MNREEKSRKERNIQRRSNEIRLAENLSREKLQYLNAKRPLTHRILDETEDGGGYSPSPRLKDLWLKNMFVYDIFDVDTKNAQKNLDGTEIIKYTLGKTSLYEKREWRNGKVISRRVYQSIPLEKFKFGMHSLTKADIEYLKSRQKEYEDVVKEYKLQIERDKKAMKMLKEATKKALQREKEKLK